MGHDTIECVIWHLVQKLIEVMDSSAHKCVGLIFHGLKLETRGIQTDKFASLPLFLITPNTLDEVSCILYEKFWHVKKCT